MTVHINNLRLRTIIGVKDWERKHKQDLVINVEFEFDRKKAVATDNIKETVDYKAITKRIIAEVQSSNFYLLEKLADHILKIVMDNRKIISATVKVDKPHALRFVDSVSISCSAKR